MVSGLFRTARELPRLREISSVFVRHGLGDLVRRAGIATLLERAGQVLQWGEASEVAHLEPQQRAKLAFEQLGPTFVCRSTISCRRSNRRSAALRLRCSATLSANPTPPPQSRRYTGPNSPAARQ
jgi:hypothetical protein